MITSSVATIIHALSPLLGVGARLRLARRRLPRRARVPRPGLPPARPVLPRGAFASGAWASTIGALASAVAEAIAGAMAPTSIAPSAIDASILFMLVSPQSASAPVSPVRMRTTCSRSETKIFPSPILPVFAAFSIASITRSSKIALDRGFDLHFRQEVDDVFRAAIELRVALLAAETLDLGDGDALHADPRQGLADLVELERLDDGGDKLHGDLPWAMNRVRRRLRTSSSRRRRRCPSRCCSR